MSAPNFLWLKDFNPDHLNLIGLPNTLLSELHQLTSRTPNSFCLTSAVLPHFLSTTGTKNQITRLLQHLDCLEPDQLQYRSRQIHRLINSTPFPHTLASTITHQYHHLNHHRPVITKTFRFFTSKISHPHTYSSVHLTSGDSNLLQHIKKTWANTFSPTRLALCHRHQIDPLNLHTSILIQELINPQVSGKLFTHADDTLNKHLIKLTAVWGTTHRQISNLSDTYLVSKTPLSIISKEIISQPKHNYFSHTHTKIKNVPKNKQHQPKLTDNQIITLAKIGKQIHQRHFFPHVISWLLAQDKPYFYHLAPFDHQAHQPIPTLPTTQLLSTLIKANPVSPGIFSGPLQIITSTSQLHRIKPGYIILTPLEPHHFFHTKTSALITHASLPPSATPTFKQFLQIPLLTHCPHTTKLKSDHIYTINGTSGDIFQGGLPTTTLHHINNNG